MNTPSNTLPMIPAKPIEALIVQGNTVQYIRNCMDCPLHTVVSDPDPDDWFCDDDIAVLCTGTLPIGTDTYRFPHRAITVACRPYNDRKESDIPGWCPHIVK